MNVLRPSMRTVVRVVTEEAAIAGIPPELVLLTDDRRRTVAWVRQRACTRLRAMGFSYPAIGDAIGRDHSTVIFAIKASPSETAPRLNARRLTHRANALSVNGETRVFMLPPSALAPIPMARLMGARA